MKKATKGKVSKALKKVKHNLPENLPAKKEPAPVPAEIISNLVLHGNIGQMSAVDKVKYYQGLCRSLGLNPLTQPFQIITLQGKEVLYATKTATEQLRKIYGVSVEKIELSFQKEICITTVSVKDSTGRTDGATGAVNIAGMKGDMLANAIMKSETKAKRRATLSICGLGMLDETEIETIPGAATKIINVTPEPITDAGEMDTPKKSAEKQLDAAVETQRIDDMFKRGSDLIESSQTVEQFIKRGPEIIKIGKALPEDKRKTLSADYLRRKEELEAKEKGIIDETKTRR